MADGKLSWSCSPLAEGQKEGGAHEPKRSENVVTSLTSQELDWSTKFQLT